VTGNPLIANQWIKPAKHARLISRCKKVCGRFLMGLGMNKTELADFLRKRREALQPEDVGLHRGPRRRTIGLRREEVAELIGMSTDYYSRLERGDGPKPSDQMAAAIARGLRLSFADRDHLFLLIGHHTPMRSDRNDHVSPGLMRILDRLEDTPAQVMGGTGETLAQTPVARALFGEQTTFTGLARACVFRWFTHPSSRLVYLAEDHLFHGRYFTAQLRISVARQGPQSFAANVVDELLLVSDEFASLWSDHQVDLQHLEQKRFQHPEVGRMDLHCQILRDPDQSHTLLVFTATPGTASSENLRLLSVIGDQHLQLSNRNDPKL
jgi:transcriptional regulator with XRE-family HTH domain